MIAGQKFNSLTALHKTKIQFNRNEVFWVCECECGNIVEVSERYLKLGIKKSCGCKRNNLPKPKQINVTHLPSYIGACLKTHGNVALSNKLRRFDNLESEIKRQFGFDVRTKITDNDNFIAEVIKDECKNHCK